MADDIEPTGTDESVLPLQEFGSDEEDDVLAHGSTTSAVSCAYEQI
ncbi:hypothetical protein [Streptomyces sp. NPDC060198]